MKTTNPFPTSEYISPEFSDALIAKAIGLDSYYNPVIKHYRFLSR
jgi:hypothetical protein